MRIGQNTASAMGQGAFQLANMLGGIQNREDDLVTKLARQRIEREKNDAEATTQAKTDEGFRLFQGYISENPNSTPAQRADAALQFGVTGDDRAKNYLSANLGGNRFGESQSENVRKGERFTDTMKFRTDKARSDYEFAESKWKAAIEASERAQDEKERSAKANEAIRWASIRDNRAKTLMGFSSRGGLVIDNDDEYMEAQRELDENKTSLANMQAEQSKALPDPMLKANYDALLKRTSDLEKEIQRVNIEGYGPSAPASSGFISKERESKPVSATPAGANKPKPARAMAPAKSSVNPNNNLRVGTLEDF